MKLTRTLALGLFAAASLVVIAQEAMTLRRTFTEGQVDVYEVATNIAQTVDTSAFGGPPQDMNIDTSMKLAYVTGKVNAEKGTAAMKVTVKDIEFKMDGPMGQMPGMGEMPKEYTITGILNARNQMSDIKIEGLPAAMAMMTNQQTTQQMNSMSFPEGPIAVGGTWKYEFPDTEAFKGMTPNITAKFVGEKEWEGLKALDISFVGTIDMKMDPSAMGGEMPGGMKMMIVGTMDMKGSVLIEKGTGRLLFSESVGTSNLKLEMTDMGTTLPMTGKSTSIMKLVVKK